MVTSLKQKAVVGAAGVALLAGAGGAYAATRSTAAPAAKSRPNLTAQRNAFLDDAARRLGTTRAKLEAALTGAAIDRIDAAVAAGRLTKAQGDAIKQRIRSGNGPFLGLRPAIRGGRPGPGFGLGFRLGFGPGRSLDAAATYLGMTDAQLRKQLRSGKSLAQLAKSKGKSLSGLESAIRSAVTARLDNAVANKRMTAPQRDEFLKRFDRALPSLVSGSLPAGPRFRHFGHP